MQDGIADWLGNWEALLYQPLVKVRARLATVSLHNKPDQYSEESSMVIRPLTVAEVNRIHSNWEQFKQHPESTRTDALLNWARKHVANVATEATSHSSLFELVRVEAAIHEVDPHGRGFQLVLGDLSGIQSYLFAIARTGEEGIARRLRARSFILGMLAQSASVSLTSRLGLSPACILMSTGGIFMLVLPRECSWLQWKTDMDQYLFKTFEGELQLHMAGIDVQRGQVHSMSALISELHSRVQREKSRPFASMLQSTGEWSDMHWVHDSSPVDNCSIELELGSRLPQAIGVQLVPGGDSDGGTGFKLWESLEIHLLTPQGESHPDAIWTEYWNGNAPQFIESGWVQASSVSNYVPTTDKQTMTFVEMAETAVGKKVLGVLKADIDHLGLLLSFGLKGCKNDYSLYEYMYISRNLHVFTSEIITSKIIEQFPKVYTVFSGGDDLFFIGPWSDMPEFAMELNEQFRFYVEVNKAVTLSAALLFVSPKTPMASLAHIAEQSLSEAKDTANEIRLSSKSTLNAYVEGRNQVCLHGQIMEWEHLKKVWDKAKEWDTWLKHGGCTHSLMRKLLQFAEMRRVFTACGKVEGLRYQSLLAYTINRFSELKGDTEAKRSQEACKRWLIQLRKMHEIEADTWWFLMPSIYRLFYFMQERGEKPSE
ncbi:type III-A CRISPR-associated protein Cas10/Csm1 [Paenibacillus apiarius]|uniref:type III-A CRISPR-associated protein Cas10/Csm1 n=1 Tax=Paenibacillus apiarius TaxID=46240 RepID=UPI003B3A8A97